CWPLSSAMASAAFSSVPRSITPWRAIFWKLRGTPIGHHQSSGNDQGATREDGQRGQGAKADQIDDLPDHEKGRDIKADHPAELQRRQVQHQAIAEQQAAAAQEQPQPGHAGVVIDPHPHHRVAKSFQGGGANQEQQRRQVGHGGSLGWIRGQPRMVLGAWPRSFRSRDTSKGCTSNANRALRSRILGFGEKVWQPKRCRNRVCAAAYSDRHRLLRPLPAYGSIALQGPGDLVAGETEGQETGADAPAAGVDPAALGLALNGASREEADAFLKDQRKLLQLQTRELAHELDLRHWSLWVRHVSGVLKLAFEFSVALVLLGLVALLANEVWSAAHDN